MLFNKMFDVAKNVVMQKQNNKTPLNFNDTICVVCTKSNKIVVGISYFKYINNQPVLFHAEVDACNKLKENSDTSVSEISVFNAFNLQPVLPCKECVSRIIELNPENDKAILVLPDICIPLSQMEQFISGQSMNQGQFRGVNDMSKYENDNYSYFTERLNQILVDDEDDEEEEKKPASKKKKEKPAKKGLFNFFKGKGNGENQ